MLHHHLFHLKNYCRVITTRRPLLPVLGLVFAAVIGPVSLFLYAGTGKAAEVTPWTPWSKPMKLLPYVSQASLTQNPLDLSLSYVALSNSYGIVSGSETRAWNHATFSKLGDNPSPGSGAAGVYDEFGTLHAVWGGDSLFYARVLDGANNVSKPRNLLLELYGHNNTAYNPRIAYSRQQKKLFVVYIERVENGGAWPVNFTESSDFGTTWSQPLKVGELSGAPPQVLVDLDGNPHIFYGQSDENSQTSRYFHRVRAGNSWSEPEDITGGHRERLFDPGVALAPNGDIWVVWAAGETDVARREAATGKWQTWFAVSGIGTYTGWPAIAVGSGGNIWVMWVERNDNSALMQTRFTIYRNGQWYPAQVGFVFGDKEERKDAAWNRVFWQEALYAKGLIYLVLVVAPDEPEDVSKVATLYLTTVPEGWYPGQVLEPTPTAQTVTNTTTTGQEATPTPVPANEANLTPVATAPARVTTVPVTLFPATSVSKGITVPADNPVLAVNNSPTPLRVKVPVQPVGSGIGPELVLPTPTVLSSVTPVPPTPIPSTRPPVTTRGTTAALTPLPYTSPEAGVNGKETGKTGPRISHLPPSPGPLVWPGISGVLLGWGALNLAGRRRLKPFRIIGDSSGRSGSTLQRKG